jgi:predicted Zn-dependent peptidase
VVSEDHSAPVVTVAVYYNVGFRVEPKGRTGFAHLFEHMMFQGSANVKKFERKRSGGGEGSVEAAGSLFSLSMAPNKLALNFLGWHLIG